VTNALSFELDHCDDPIVYERLTARLTEIDLSLAQAVAEKVGAPTPDKQTKPNHGKKAPGLSQMDFMPEKPTIATRRVAILIADGYDPVSYNGIKTALKAQGALPFTIGPKRQPVKADGGKETTQPDHHFQGMRSTMFDAIFVPAGPHAKTIASQGLPRFWIREAFGHLKAIGAVGEGVQAVKAALSEAEGVELASTSSTELVESYGVVTVGAVEPSSFSDAVQIVKEGKGFVENFFFQISQHKNWKRELDGLADMVSC